MNTDLCKKIVEYGRTQIVGNEQQFLAVMLSALTAYAPDSKQFVSTILIGESSGGKTHVQTTAFKLIPRDHVFDLTASSEKAPIYSEKLRSPEVKIIKFGEYNKLPKAVLEFMKALSGDDPDFAYEVTDAAAGNTRRIEVNKKPYSVTYAQVDIDRELETRLFIIPIEENMNINRCVSVIKLGAERVNYMGRTYDVTPKPELEHEIISAISSLQHVDMPVKIRFPFALIDMVNHARADSKRHAQLISSLIAASCRLNWMNRETDGDKLLASAQDVVNVLSMFDLLQATMMAIDNIDMTLYKYLCKNTNQYKNDLVNYVQRMGLVELTKTELERRLDKLYNENYIDIQSSTTGEQYSANPRKQIITLKVDWDEIMQFDDGVVVDPITGLDFNNIKEYSEYAKELHEVRSGQKVKDDVDSIEAKIREKVLEHAPQLIPCTKSNLAQRVASMAGSGQIGYMNVFPVIDSMITEGHLYIEDDHIYTTYNELGIDTTHIPKE